MPRYALLLAAITAIFFAQAAAPAQPSAQPTLQCQTGPAQYGNLAVEHYATDQYAITPLYWKNGITRSAAEAWLRKLGVKPLSIIPGGFNTNLPGLREPVDFVEIEGKVIVGRSEFWPILFEGKAEAPYLGIVPRIGLLPRTRRWAIASGPWIRLKNGNSRQEFVVQFFGNELSDTPWIEYTYRRNGSKLILVKVTDHRKNWSREHHWIMFGWTRRRAVFVNKSGSCFAIVKGAVKDGVERSADAISVGKLMLTLGYTQALMMDGGSATLRSAENPVYLIVTKR